MKITILGGGISGLAAAHYITKHPNAAKVSKIVILESCNRLGGWIESTRNSDGVTYEHGPRTIRPVGHQGANTLALISDLGLENKVKPIQFGHPAMVNRMVYVNGQVCHLPNSFLSVFKKMPPFKKPLATAVFKDLTTPPKICDDDSLFNLVSRRFGNDFAVHMFDPMVRGICAGDCREISADAFILGPIFRREQADGGLVKSLIKSALKVSSYKPIHLASPVCSLVEKARKERWGVWSLDGGLETMVDALRNSLTSKGVEIRTGVQTETVHFSNGIEMDSQYKTDHLIAALPASQSSKLLSNSNQQLSQLLGSIPYVDVAVVNVEYQGKLELDCGPGFGLLVPSNQKDVKVLGIIFDTCMFPQGDRTVFTVMMGGRWFEPHFGQNPTIPDIEACAVQNIGRILKVKLNPVRVCAKIHRSCIAQYTVGHNSRLKEIRRIVQNEQLPLSLIGSAFDGVGVNDAIMSAKNNVDQILL